MKNETSSARQKVLYWVRKDLRTLNNSALDFAIENSAHAVFTWVPSELEPWVPGAASQIWLSESLLKFKSALGESKISLEWLEGKSTLDLLLHQVKSLKIDCVVFQWSACPQWQTIERRVREGLIAAGVQVQSYSDNVWVQPLKLLTGQGNPYQVFTPFYKALLKKDWPEIQISSASFFTQKLAKKPNPNKTLEKYKEAFLKTGHPWEAKVLKHWSPGEEGAWESLNSFLKSGIDQYQEERDFPAIKGTSQLSPHLVWGEITPLAILQVLREGRSEIDFKNHPWVRQLAWREFAMYLLRHFPYSSQQPLRKEYWDFPYENGESKKAKSELKKWQVGKTGFPIVDAAQKQLWETGWMHNRLRMITASFLIKDLNLSWRLGAEWFWNTLVDADLANNTFGWQWAGGCGADAAPYFRVFNPTTQGEKFDPKGRFVKTWLNPEELLIRPMVDHDQKRKEALKRFEVFRKPSKK